MAIRTTALSAIFAAFIPWLIFAPRRLNRSFNENNPVNSIMDLQISAAQSANAYKGATAATKLTEAADYASSAGEKIKNMSRAAAETTKDANILTKAAKFTMNNINPIIGIGEGVRVIFSDNKEHDAIIGGSAFGGMLLAENFCNNLIGRPKTKLVNGKLRITPRDAQYKKYSFLNNAIHKSKNVITNSMVKNKTLAKYVKLVPGIGKGLIFASFSIGGYSGFRKLGEIVADKVAPIQEAA